MKTFSVDTVVDLVLVLEDTLINISVELSYLAAHLCDAVTVDSLRLAHTEGCNLVLRKCHVCRDVILELVAIVMPCESELKTCVLHCSGIHCNRTVCSTSLCRNRNAVEKVLRNSLVPVCVELELTAEHSIVETDVESLLLLPLEGCVHIVRDCRTCDLVAIEAVSIVTTGHCRHELVVTDVLVTEHTIRCTELQEAYELRVNIEERLLVDTPSEGC